MSRKAIIGGSGTTRGAPRSNRAAVAALLYFVGGVVGPVVGFGGCVGDGSAVNVRWRIAQLQTGELDDPRDVSDANGVCCQSRDPALGCTGQPGWHVTRVRLELAYADTSVALANPPSGLDAPCGNRELTTPFDLPSGNFAITLGAVDDAEVVEAVSPSPEIRTLRKAEIVNLDVIQLSVSTQ